MSLFQSDERSALWRVRTRFASGLVALVPIVVTIVVLRFVFTFTASILLPVIDPAVADWPWVWRAGLSVATLLVGIYLLGELATHVVGRRVLDLGERILLRVPFVKVIYSASKQVAAAFRGTGSGAFKSVVFVDFPRPGMKAVAFLTSTFTRSDGSQWNSVFIPTTPNPTTGFLQVMPASDVELTSLTVEDGVKMIMSLGALAPGMLGGSGTPAAPHSSNGAKLQ